MSFHIHWVDGYRKAQRPSHPSYPHGVDLDVSRGAARSCRTELPYPARRCGYYHVECLECGLTVAVTTAGRPDDPRSVTVPCKSPPAVPASLETAGHA